MGDPYGTVYMFFLALRLRLDPPPTMAKCDTFIKGNWSTFDQNTIVALIFRKFCKLYALFTRCYTMYVGCSLGHFQGLLICLFGHKRSSGHMAKCLIIWLREYERWVSRNRETKSHIWRVLVHCLKTIIYTILYG